MIFLVRLGFLGAKKIVHLYLFLTLQRYKTKYKLQCLDAFFILKKYDYLMINT